MLIWQAAPVMCVNKVKSGDPENSFDGEEICLQLSRWCVEVGRMSQSPIDVERFSPSVSAKTDTLYRSTNS